MAGKMENIGCYTLHAAHFLASLPHASLPRSRTCADSSALHLSYSSNVPPKQLSNWFYFFLSPTGMFKSFAPSRNQ